MALLFLSESLADFCNVYGIGKAILKVVISFLNRADPF
jgi:hypothetical protein